jgi:hypothetical protein
VKTKGFMKKSNDQRGIIARILLAALVVTGGLVLYELDGSVALDDLSMFSNGGISVSDSITKVVISQRSQDRGALFDVMISLPEEKSILRGERLTFATTLYNIGRGGKTDVELVYIVSDNKGNIIYVENENRVVETQDTFVKNLDLGDLRPGSHKLFVELLYSNLTAVASDEFTVLLFR